MHVLLQLSDLLHSQLVLTEVENLFAEHLQYAEVVLAEVQVRFASTADIRDKGLPGSVPLVLYNLHQNGVGLAQQALHTLVEVASAA